MTIEGDYINPTDAVNGPFDPHAGANIQVAGAITDTSDNHRRPLVRQYHQPDCGCGEHAHRHKCGGGNDTVNIGSLATVSSNTGGVLTTIRSSLTINGQGGTDTINVDDSGDTTGRAGTLTSTALTGLGMSGSITYATDENLNIHLGSGADTFAILPQAP